MFTYSDEIYPTRVKQPIAPIKRRESIVHCQQACRSQGPLTAQQVQQYERDGFLTIKSFLSSEQVKQFRQDLVSYGADEQLLQSAATITEAGTNQIRSIFDVHKWSTRFDELTREPRLLAIVQQLLGNGVYIHQSRINFKPAFHGKGFNWHSDFETWHAEDGMPQMRALSCSIALSDNNPFNGPLMLIPGSHRYFIPCVGQTPENNYQCSLQKQQVGTPSEQHLTAMADKNGIVAPTGPAGSLILFECNTLHASNANMSPWPRSNLFFVYNSIENQLTRPFCGTSARPEFLGNREDIQELTPLSNLHWHKYG